MSTHQRLEHPLTTLNRLLTAALGLFLVSAGVAKFTTGHVFQYIEYRSGIDLFYPFVNNLTGIAEIAGRRGDPVPPRSPRRRACSHRR